EPGFVIWENADYAAILSNEPYMDGHTLVVPKHNYHNDVFELSDEVYFGLMAAVKEVGKLLKGVFKPDRLLVWVRGYEVAHVHVHLIPSHMDVDLVSAQAHKAEEGELKEVWEKIRRG
ncbi:HIT family protein, partial [Candidatus Peregrinibacteria bacterium]|nr:HIT family protein [Candidatus Peregrinibacteria bacterium]